MSRVRQRRHRTKLESSKLVPMPQPGAIEITPEAYLASPHPSCARCGRPDPSVKLRTDPFWEICEDLKFTKVQWCDDCYQERRGEI